MAIDPMDKSLEGKYMGMAKVGEKGQIVIPKPARDMFGIKPGDTVLVLADIKQGIAVLRGDIMHHFAEQILAAQNEPPSQQEDADERDTDG